MFLASPPNAPLISFTNRAIFSGCFRQKYVAPVNVVADVSLPANTNSVVVESMSGRVMPPGWLFSRIYFMKSGRSDLEAMRRSTFSRVQVWFRMAISLMGGGVSQVIMVYIGGKWWKTVRIWANFTPLNTAATCRA